MQPIATIICLAFVILHIFLVGCTQSKFHGDKQIDEHKSSLESCPIGSSSMNGVCRNIFTGGFVCPNDQVFVDGYCRKTHPKGNGACGDNYKTIDTNCIELIPRSNLCPRGQTRVDGVCSYNLQAHPLCREGNQMIRGSCYILLTEKPICPEGYKVIRNRCGKKVQ